MIETSGIAEKFPDSSNIFKQVHVTKILEISSGMSDINQLLRIAVKPKIYATEVTSSFRGETYGGKIHTGFKLSVSGENIVEIHYTTKDKLHSVFSDIFSIPFFTYITLQSKHTDTFRTFAFVEDIYGTLADSRKAFVSIVFTLNSEHIN